MLSKGKRIFKTICSVIGDEFLWWGAELTLVEELIGRGGVKEKANNRDLMGHSRFRFLSVIEGWKK